MTTLTLHTNAVEAEDMNAAEAAKVEPAALLQRSLSRRWLWVIPSLLLPHLVARGISGAILFLLAVFLTMLILLL